MFKFTNKKFNTYREKDIKYYKQYISEKTIPNDKLEYYNIELPCLHKFNMEFYISMVVRQIIFKKDIECMECNKKCITTESNIIIKIYNIIEKEIKEFRKLNIKDTLNINEQNTLKKLRKDYFIYQIYKENKNEPNISLVIQMFEFLFEYAYYF